MEEKNEIKMLEQVSGVQDAEQNLREIEKEEMTEESKEMNEFADSDIRIFFNNKQAQDEKVSKWTDATLKRLGACYKNLLLEAGITDKARDTRKIYKPILDPAMERWMMDHGMEYYVKALTGVR